MSDTRAAIPVPDPPLQDDVIVLGIPGEDDLAPICAACQDPEISRWTTVPSPYTEKDGREFLQMVARDWAEGNAATFTFRRHGADQLDGMVSLSLVTPEVGVVGYWTGAWARGGGLATRALTLIGEWGFAVPRVQRIDLATLPGNRASERVAAKAGYGGGELVPFGMVHHGVRRHVRVWSRVAAST